MSETVFILGAGASKEAGAPLMPEFIDSAKDLLKRNLVGNAEKSFKMVFDAIGDLQKVHSKSQMDINNVKSVFTAFEMADTLHLLDNYRDKEKYLLIDAMKEVIITTIQERMKLPVNSDRIPEPPPPYNDFTRLIMDILKGANPKQSVSVITFNYDLALDYSCYWNHIPIWYGINSKPSGSLSVLKLHGSMNWGYCIESQEIIPWDINDYFRKKHWILDPRTKMISLPIGSQIAELSTDQKRIQRLPLVVPPTWNKSSYYSLLSPVWASAAHELSEAENIFVIGYSLPIRYILQILIFFGNSWSTNTY